MDRSWILHYRNRFSAEYIAGVNSFLDFAKANSGRAVLINCPCNDCCNHRKHDYATVRSHLHIKGMMVHYLRWIYHGEPIVQPDDSDESEDESEENRDKYNELIDDHRRGTYLEEDTQERDAEQDRRQAEQDRRQAEQLAQQDRRTRQLEALVLRLAATAGIDPVAFLDTKGGTTSAGDGIAPGGS